jgi:23S rRNA-/tRNA-specific pseudouridylate synthase
MLHIGHPILGDPLYPIPDHTPDCSVTTTTTTSSKKKPRLKTSPIAAVDECLSVLSSHHHSEEVVAISSKCYPRLCLHALYLKFNHPVTKEVMEITAHEANMI